MTKNDNPTDSSPCDGPAVVHTVGHSNQGIDKLLDLLEPHAIELLVDIRRWPSSRKFPHFNREPLAAAVEKRGIEYEWMQELGGYRRPSSDSPNTAWKVGAFRAYADFMLTEEFRRVFARLAEMAHRKRTVLMCAEALPWRCHRQILSDAFVVRGWTVRHIVGASCEVHRVPDFAQIDGERILYRRGDTLFDN